MVRQKFVKVFGGSGGINNDSIPVYSDDKAPNGDQLIVNGKQVMLKNDFELVCVDRAQLIEGVDNISAFFSRNGYARVWRLNPVSMVGEDIVPGKQAWVEDSHLTALEVVQEEEEEDTGGEISYEEVGIAIEIIVRFIKSIFD